MNEFCSDESNKESSWELYDLSPGFILKMKILELILFKYIM